MLLSGMACLFMREIKTELCSEDIPVPISSQLASEDNSAMKGEKLCDPALSGHNASLHG